ncbi:dihydrolipoyl dehydrogenase [Blattabacterium cuenoti]|uniref:dihydrolipoyl dehydrogenase n=1 Tax=Blattabacterium cuenoti TaxID=1653831 RepID=UPI00163BE8DE|nr:dihydrolipoyl dehydrogenase [Blattabacterium cuenoti]
MHFDVIILGSGPGGYVASIRSSQLGMKTAIVEKSEIGGNYLNNGCISIKSILKSAKTFNMFKKYGEFFGINNNMLKINFSNIIEKSKKTTKDIKHNISYLMKKNNVHVFHGNARLKKGKKVEILKNGKKLEEYSAKNIIIATGRLPKKIKENYYDNEKIITYKEVINLSKVPKKIIIVGGGSIGIELAFFYNCMGTKVFLIEESKNIFSNGDNDISDYLKYSFEKMGISIFLFSLIKNIYKKNNKLTVDIITSCNKNKKIRLEVDLILFSTIGIPDTDTLGLEKIGIQTEKKFIIVDDNYKTNVDGYYAIGDVINTPFFSHVAYHEAINCVENIKGLNPQKIDYNNVPICVYSSPEIATVGYTEKESKERGYKIKIFKFPFKSMGCINKGNNGFIKVIFDEKYDEWLGCHMIGDNVIDLISEVVIARKLETTSYEILNTIHPYPSLSSSIFESISSAYGKAIHL